MSRRAAAESTEVLRKLLGYIAYYHDEDGRPPFLVSHAWTAGPNILLVYEAPLSAVTWGLCGDTRESIVGVGPRSPVDDAAYCYYVCDLEEGRVSASSPTRATRAPSTGSGFRATAFRHGRHTFRRRIEHATPRGAAEAAAGTSRPAVSPTSLRRSVLSDAGLSQSVRRRRALAISSNGDRR
ncbi:hypothetical protein [Mycobacterium saskatchewanense]|uniref:hypothetical protein n=1 Tax=Mycobacterium saskatchewanense TaxID=220927 RepID=UPI0015D1409F|nr:hypothetical protein [Mycobacterium saskatchewanense]